MLASSSLVPGISTAISTQPDSPSRASFLAPSSSSSSSCDPPAAAVINSVSRSVFPAPYRARVLSTSALTPTMASVPSAKQMRALPLVPGRMSVSALRGRNWGAARPSGRRGGVSEREEWR